MEKEKLKLGIQIIISESYKLILIYLLAYLLNCIVPTLIAHLTFFILRQVCFGYHFNNLIICLATSIIAFPITIKYLADYYSIIPTFLLYIIFIIILVFIYKLAPKGTEKHPIINQHHKKYLRRKMAFRVFIIVGIFCISTFEIKVFIAYGALLESLMLISQSIKGEYFYENELDQMLKFNF